MNPPYSSAWVIIDGIPIRKRLLPAVECYAARAAQGLGLFDGQPQPDADLDNRQGRSDGFSAKTFPAPLYDQPRRRRCLQCDRWFTGVHFRCYHCRRQKRRRLKGDAYVYRDDRREERHNERRTARRQGRKGAPGRAPSA